MNRTLCTKLIGLALIMIIQATATGIAQSKSQPVRILVKRVAQSVFHSATFSPNGKYLATPLPMLALRRCTQFTIGGRLTRRVDVFGDEVNQYRPVKGEQVFLWNENGDEIARTRTDRNGDYSFPNRCSGTYTVHPGLASPLLESRYEPSSRTTALPAPINQVLSPRHLDFVRKQPPPPRQPEFPEFD